MIIVLLASLQGAPQRPTYPIKVWDPLTYVIDYEPYWSPTGREIALISSRHGGLKLHILSLDHNDDGGYKMKQLTFGDTEEDSPAWSPDGKTIAFASIRKGISEICTIRPDGTGIKQITHEKGNNIHPAWSPDGNRILFNTTLYESENRKTRKIDAGDPKIGEPQDNFIDLVTTAPDGSDWQRLTKMGGYTYAFYSPDGKRIVHRRSLGERSQIWVMKADGNDDHNISGDNFQDGWPSWGPDSKRICFVRRDAGNKLNICVMNTDGTGFVQLTDMHGDCSNPRWSPNGKRMLFSRRDSSTLMTVPAPL